MINYKTEIKKTLARVMYVLLRLRHRQGPKKNIYLFTTRRGGSTWLTQILSSDPKSRYIDHALGYYNADFYERYFLPKVKLGQYINKDNKIIEYFNRLESGKLITKTAWRKSRGDFVRESDRLVLKITEAKALIEWIKSRVDGYFLYQIRHPIATSLSIMNLGWGMTVNAYLDNQEFVERYLTKDQYNLARDIMDQNNMLLKYVLNWILENMVPIKNHPMEGVTWVSYEELVLFPEEVMSRLSKVLDIVCEAEMLDSYKKPTRSSKLSSSYTREVLEKGEKKSIISKWRNQVNEKEESRIFQILNQFEVNCYNFGEDLPSRRYRLIREKL